MSKDKYVLETVKLSKSFGGLKAVNEVDICINKFCVHAIIGPNGAGKTTFFNLINGILKPSSGKVLFNGNDITGWPTFKTSRIGIGRTMQITSLFEELTVYENLWVGLQSRKKFLNPLAHWEKNEIIKEEVNELLKFLNLEKHSGLEVKGLCYGDQRLLEIGLALTTKPKLLMLDEPTAGLGIVETKEIMKQIAKMSEEVCIVLVEHDMDFVMNIADYISVLADGAVLAEGTPKQIKNDHRVIEAYLGSE